MDVKFSKNIKRYKNILLIFLVFVLLMVVSGCFWDADETFSTEEQLEQGYQDLKKVNSPEERQKRAEKEKARAKEEKARELSILKGEREKERAKAKTALYEAGPPEEIFTNTNIYSVQNGGGSPSFSILEPAKIAMVKTYHWNNAQGKAPGTIGLTDKNGKSYGPWKASSEPGQGGVKSAYWKVTPNAELPAGIYTIIDSDPSTWAQNKESKGEGMAWVFAATAKND